MAFHNKLLTLTVLIVVSGCAALVNGNLIVCSDCTHECKGEYLQVTLDRRPTKVTTTCCKSVSKAPFSFEIRGYKHQGAVHPCVEAIIFDTAKGKVCTDPKARWLGAKIRELNARNIRET